MQSRGYPTYVDTGGPVRRAEGAHGGVNGGYPGTGGPLRCDPPQRPGPVPLQRGHPLPPLSEARRPSDDARMASSGTYFAVWAPAAEYVAVIGDFNGWHAGTHPLRPRESSGIWEGFVPGAGHGRRPTSITSPRATTATASTRPTPSPSSTRCRRAPPRSSADLDYAWDDGDWMATRRTPQRPAAPRSPSTKSISAPGCACRRRTTARSATASWRRSWPSYVQPARLHARRVPAADGAPVLRVLGLPGDRLLRPDQPLRHAARPDVPDRLSAPAGHRRHPRLGAGPLPHRRARPGLFRRHPPLRARRPAGRAFIPTGAAASSTIGRHEVRSFLLEQRPVLAGPLSRRRPARGCRRLDAVPRLFAQGRRVGAQRVTAATRTCDAIAFLRTINEEVYRNYPDVQTIAEESTAWPMVSRPTYLGGLGFGLKWDMGWMHDTLRVLPARSDPSPVPPRRADSSAWCTPFTENYVLPLSHDEVVHGKGSLLARMPGDDWQKFANLRLLFGYHVGHAGQEAAVHGRRVRPRPRVEPRHQPRLAPDGTAAARRRAALGDGPEPPVPRGAGPARTGLPAVRASSGWTATTAARPR